MAAQGGCGGGLEVHHVLGIAISGKVVSDMAELTTLCHKHNRMIGEPTGDPKFMGGNTRW